MDKKKLPLKEQVELLERGVFTRPKANGEQADKLLRTINRVKNPLETARLFFVRGVSRYYQFLLQDAQEDLGEALERFAHLRDAAESEDQRQELRSLVLQVKSHIGSTFLVLGDFARAIHSFRTVRDEAQEHHDAGTLAYAYVQLGKAYMLLGRYELATSYLEQALAAEEQSGRNGLAGSIYLCLGTIYSKTSRTGEALELLLQSLDLLEQQQFAETPEVLTIIGSIYFNQDDLIMAEQYATIALEFSRQTGVRAMEAESLKLCGLLAHRKNQAGDAHHFLTKALEVSRSIKNHTQALEIARLLVTFSDASEAAPYCREVIALAEEIYQQSVDSCIAAVVLQDKHEDMLRRQHTQKHERHRLNQIDERLQAVSLLGSEINALNDGDAVLELVSRRLLDLVPADTLSLYIMDPRASSLSLKTKLSDALQTNQIRGSIPLDDTSSIAAYCVRTRNPVLIRDICREGKFYCEDGQSASLSSWLAVPLTAHEEVYGAVLLGGALPESFTSSDLHIIQMCANLTASALAAAAFTLQFKQVSRRENLLSKYVDKTIDQLSIYDKLTGLPNKLLLFERAVPLLQQAGRSSMPVAVCSLELHSTSEESSSSDESLKAVTRRMASVLRKSDLIARVQDTHFVAVFNDLKEKEAVSVIMDKLIREISRPFAVKNRVCTYDAHGGISFFPEHGNDLPALIRSAESARQRAQLFGNNRYAVADVKPRQDYITG